MQDIAEIFEEYENLAREVDAVFARVAEKHPECVTCKVGCSDCCHAMFDLSLVEAMYLNREFLARQDEESKTKILEEADKADREIYRVKRDLAKRQQEGESPDVLLQDVAATKVRCPLLLETDTCFLYENRPLTCRLYGIPMSIGGQSHTCGMSGFEQGKEYPTVFLDKIHARLTQLSVALVEALRSRHIGMEGVYVPVSMALLTTYDDEYLGISKSQKSLEEEGPATWNIPGPRDEEE
ncbi:MAG: YkgJ family cysteine cluster protein [Desulfovibrionales bacterium]